MKISKISTGEFAIKFLGRCVVGARGFLGSGKHSEIAMLSVNPNYGHPFVPRRIDALELSMGLLSSILTIFGCGTNPKICLSIIKGVVINVIYTLFGRRFHDSAMHEDWNISYQSMHNEVSDSGVPDCPPVPFRQPLEIIGIDNRNLILRQANKAVGWITWLRDFVSSYTIFRHNPSLKGLCYAAIIILLILPVNTRAQGSQFSDRIQTVSGQAVRGANTSVCIGATVTSFSVVNNFVTLNMPSNPLNMGFRFGSNIYLYGYTGTDAFVNSSNSPTGFWVIQSITPTTIVFSLVHGNYNSVGSGAVAQSSASGCLPLTTIFTDVTLTTQQANPFQADGLGNVSFWNNPGTYLIQYSAPTITTRMQTATLPCIPGTICAINTQFPWVNLPSSATPTITVGNGNVNYYMSMTAPVTSVTFSGNPRNGDYLGIYFFNTSGSNINPTVFPSNVKFPPNFTFNIAPNAPYLMGWTYDAVAPGGPAWIETPIWGGGGGGGSSFYQTVAQSGSSLPQEQILDFPGNMSCVDNPGGNSTDCTPVTHYSFIENNAFTLPQEQSLNIVPPLVATDNSANQRTDITCPVAVGVGGSHSSGCVPDPGASGTTGATASYVQNDNGLSRSRYGLPHSSRRINFYPRSVGCRYLCSSHM